MLASEAWGRPAGHNLLSPAVAPFTSTSFFPHDHSKLCLRAAAGRPTRLRDGQMLAFQSGRLQENEWMKAFRRLFPPCVHSTIRKERCLKRDPGCVRTSAGFGSSPDPQQSRAPHLRRLRPLALPPTSSSGPVAHRPCRRERCSQVEAPPPIKLQMDEGTASEVSPGDGLTLSHRTDLRCREKFCPSFGARRSGAERERFASGGSSWALGCYWELAPPPPGQKQLSGQPRTPTRLDGGNLLHAIFSIILAKQKSPIPESGHARLPCRSLWRLQAAG